jgi:hypothetical protein
VFIVLSGGLLKTPSFVWLLPLALAGSLSHADDRVVRPTEVEVCTVSLQSMMSEKTGATLTCSDTGLGKIKIGDAYAKGWRLRLSQDASALCNRLAPCLVLVLER